jgi:hypothetical protein
MSLEHSPTWQATPAFHPHLTRAQLAERLHLDAVTVTRRWRAWGLRPIRLSGRLLFPEAQVRELESRAMRGEFVGQGG